MQVVRESAALQPGDVAVAVILHVLVEVVPVVREVVASAVDGIIQAVAAVVFQVVALIGVVAACLPLEGADVAVPASSGAS